MNILDGVVIGVQAVALHFGGPAASDMRTVVPGVYAALPSGFGGGVYRNSYGDTSVWAGKTWRSGPWSLTAGGVTGYSSRPVLPMLLPGYVHDLGGVSLRVTYAHKPSRGRASAVLFSIEKEWK